MELRHLRYFCAVAERRSFTQAARHLHISQSGLSGQVRDLEREIGVTLLQRNQRDVSLTAEGALFLNEAQDILARSQRAVEMVVRAAEGTLGKLSVGLCGPATAPFLPALIRDFRSRHKGVAVELKDYEPAKQPAAVASGLIDIGFTRCIEPEFRKVLRSEILFREPLIVALPKGHLLSAASDIRLSQLATERFILYSREAEPCLFDAIVDACQRAKFSPRLAGSPNAWQSLLTLVEAGEGIALVPRCVWHLRSKDVTFRPIGGRACLLDIIVAWRLDEPSVSRDSFLNLLHKRRSEIGKMMEVE